MGVKEDEIRSLLFIDLLPYDLCIETEMGYKVVIPKGATIPCRRSVEVALSEENQQELLGKAAARVRNRVDGEDGVPHEKQREARQQADEQKQYLHRLCVRAHRLCAPLADGLADENAGRARRAVCDDAQHLEDGRGDAVGRNRLRAEVAEDRRLDGHGEAPNCVRREHRRACPDKVAEQRQVEGEEVRKAEAELAV